MKFHIYKDRDGEWRWRLKSPNGRTITASGEGYSAKSNCRRAVNEPSGATHIPVDDDASLLFEIDDYAVWRARHHSLPIGESPSD